MTTPTPRDKFWFVLGRESLIAVAELRAVLGLKKFDYSPPILKVDELSLRGGRFASADAAIPQQSLPNYGIATVALGDLAMTDPKTLIKRLGGTIKIAKEMAENVSAEEMEKIIVEELKTVIGKINFGISIYDSMSLRGSPPVGGRQSNPHANTAKQWDRRASLAMTNMAKNLGLKIKKILKADGLSVRYVENREAILSSVTVEKNGLTGRGREFLIQQNGKNFSLAKTEAVQPFEEFSARDFGRPGRDDVSGMLPPKLAIIMINLAQAPKGGVLLDPFCGSGTIISEALLLGYKNIIGSDITEKSVADTKLNIDWTRQRYGLETDKLKIFQSDIKNINRHVAKKSIDAIATEPYLGAPLKGNESREVLLRQVGGLKTLYIAAFKQFSAILNPHGAVVFIIPCFKFKNDWITIDCQKEIEALGFKHVPFLEQYPHLLYARPNQRVGREIWRFEMPILSRFSSAENRGSAISM